MTSKMLIAIPAIALAGLGLAACGSTAAKSPAPVVTHTVTASPAAPKTSAPATSAPATPAPAKTVYVQPAPAKIVYVPAPAPAGPSGTPCGGDVWAGANTSCPFAQNVEAAYNGPGWDQEYVYSPVTGQSYLMTYTQSGNWVYATGGNGASVDFNY